MLRQNQVDISSRFQFSIDVRRALPIVLAALSMLIGIQCARAQMVVRENASFGTLNNGTAHYSLKFEAPGDSLPDGAYVFSAVTQDADSTLVFRKITGEYDQGTANGKWEFQRVELKPSGSPFASDFEIIQPAVGSETNLETSYTNGVPTGKWSLSQRVANEASPTATIAVSGFVNLSEATPTGSFEYRNAACKVMGAFDQDGKLHGTWTIAFDQANFQAIETREYRSGLLIRHTLNRADANYELINDSLFIEPSNDQALRVFDFGRLPTAVLLKRVRHEEAAVDVVRRSDAAIAEALEFFGIGFNSPVFQLGDGMAKVNPVQVGFRQFPILKEEKTLNTKIANTAQEILRESEGFLTSPTVEIARMSNKDLARQCAEIETLLEVSHGMLQLCMELDDEELSFVDRNAWFKANYTAPTWPSSFTFDFDESAQTFPFVTFTPLANVTNRTALLQALNLLYDQVRSTIDTMVVQLQLAERDTYLAQREEGLILRRDSLINVFSDQTLPQTNQYHLQVARSVQNSLETAFEQYAKSDMGLKGAEVDALEQCLQYTEGLHDALSKLPLRIDRIDREYTRSVWNPYTYTFMEEVQKERIYKAYNQFILPHFISEINASASCHAYEAIPRLLIALHDRLVQLLNEDTAQVEKDLRRVSSPIEAAAILQITLPNQ